MIDYSGRFRALVRHRHGLTRITLIEYPGPDDWMAVKRRALITAGKRPRNSPDSEWIERMLDCRHSPIRRAMYSFEIEDIPSNTATHFARHVHTQPYVSTLRTDRTPPEYIKQAVDDLTKAVDGDLAARCTPVSMILDCNAEALMIMANKRLCMTAAEITRTIMQGMREVVVRATPEMKRHLVPHCIYCGGICHEYNSCGMHRHYIAAGNMVQMVYRSNVTIGTATYTGWWISRALNDNTYDRIRFNNAIKAKTAISASRLIVGDSGGFFHLAAGSVFDVDKPILWAVSAITAAATGTNNYLSYPSCTLRNNTTSTWTATQYETLYLAGTLEGSVFTVASENWLTTAPSSATQTYISLGYMYSTYQMYFYPEHPMYRLVNGILTAISTLAYEAQVAAESAQATADAARADFRRVVRVDDDGLHVGDNLSNGEVLIDSESVNVVLGGKKYSKFAGSYVQFGNYQLRRSSDGGLVFKLA